MWGYRSSQCGYDLFLNNPARIILLFELQTTEVSGTMNLIRKLRFKDTIYAENDLWIIITDGPTTLLKRTAFVSL